MAKMGRPRIEIDEKEFVKLCRLQCTKPEIAGFFDASEDTIERWCKRTYKATFAEVFAQKRVGGLISLRRSQFLLAEKNPSMAIFLGKNYLGQVDRMEVHENADGMLAALIDGLKEPENDLHEETARPNEDVAEEQTEAH